MVFAYSPPAGLEMFKLRNESKMLVLHFSRDSQRAVHFLPHAVSKAKCQITPFGQIKAEEELEWMLRCNYLSKPITQLQYQPVSKELGSHWGSNSEETNMGICGKCDVKKNYKLQNKRGAQSWGASTYSFPVLLMFSACTVLWPCSHSTRMNDSIIQA